MHINNTCIDVDECLDETPCDFRSSSCVNKDGGFKCKCLDEFKKRKMVHVLTSMSALKTCVPRANCVDLPGSFECQCLTGLSGSGTKCEDVDECITDTDNCVEYATCTNASQFLSCKCNDGYEDDDKIGDKIDHCVRGIHNCHTRSTCINKMRIQHSDASIKMIIVVLDHIAMISMNVNRTNAKTNNTATTVQIASQCM